MKANVILFVVVALAIVAGMQLNGWVDRKRAARAVRNVVAAAATAAADDAGAAEAEA